MVEAIKEQQTLIEDLSNRLKVLEDELQDGFKILNVQIINGGGGFGHNVTYQITFRDSVGQGTDPEVKSVNGAIPDSILITNNGKNYSSGSWEGSLSGTGSQVQGNGSQLYHHDWCVERGRSGSIWYSHRNGYIHEYK